MGKRSKKSNEVKQGEVISGNLNITKTQSKNEVSNKISSSSNRIKKSKNVKFGIESNKNSLVMDKKPKNTVVEVLVENQEQITLPGDITHVEANYVNCKKNKKRKQCAVPDEANDASTDKEFDIRSVKTKRKKLKQNKAEEVEVHMVNKNSPVPISKMNRNKIIQETITNIDENDDKSHQETFNVTSEIIMKKNSSHDIQQSEQKPNKKKKKKTVKEEIVDDEEIDRYCDELDEFHNKQYENWVKLIEENFNKNIKNYMVYSHFTDMVIECF